MAAYSFDDLGGGVGAGRSPLFSNGFVTRITRLSAASLSLGLVVGLGFWAYDVMVRDVRGVPVVQALSAPLRMAPENPGGIQIAHQGLSVNTVAANGVVAAPSETLVLAPKTIGLTEDDPSGFEPTPLSAVVPQGMAPMAMNGDLPLEGTSTNALSGGDDTVLASFDLGAIDLQLAVEAALQSVAAAPVEMSAPVEPKIINASKAAPQSAPVPLPRPRRAHVQPSQAQAALAAPIVLLKDSPDIPQGTRLVQLGSFDTVASAKSEWSRLSGLFGSSFSGKTPVIQEAENSAGRFFRLRLMGFGDERDAQGFCTVMLTDGFGCIPVLIR